MPVELTIHRGAQGIEGCCIEIATEHARIILDAGLPLDESVDPKDAVLNVEGLFQPGKRVDALFLTHVHLDHTGLLPFVRNDVPVFMTRGTSKLLLALSIFARQRLTDGKDVRIINCGRPTRFGDIEVTPLGVDHSAFDCVAFLVETQGKRLLYSGDLRMHGRRTYLIDRLLNYVRSKPIDVLLMEGTNIGRVGGPTVSEEALEEVLACEMKKAPGLVLAAFSPSHVDRLISFFRAAKKAGRIFIPDAYAATIMRLFYPQTGLPDPAKRGSVQIFYNHAFERKKPWLIKLHTKFEANRIQWTEIEKNLSKYVLAFRPSMLDLDFHGALPANTTCLYSAWRGYLEKPEWNRVREALAQCGGNLVQKHTSGHIFSNDIPRVVSALTLKVLIPVHTDKPQEFAQFGDKMHFLRNGETLTIEDIL